MCFGIDGMGLGQVLAGAERTASGEKRSLMRGCPPTDLQGFGRGLGPGGPRRGLRSDLRGRLVRRVSAGFRYRRLHAIATEMCGPLAIAVLDLANITGTPHAG
ncbi:hypothetical protein SAMN05421539_101603 [Jannaschia seohaensis]|uniref:Uncharacterized protein n=1 Tax=Jannaschia seohaensis TaxID=475081 RepID=A0A2Y9A1P8_9RHOB|nr:hypothetical protein BCF38_101603 [Jannaschia seohaensis]SSA38471.1 hypothetical protein SAMN05421539_101603 [Jannaschia seohaensis]